MATTSETHRSARRKLAVLIGNDKYRRENNRLTHSAKNVHGLTVLPRSIDFELVDAYVNVRQDKGMHTLRRTFVEKINEGDVVLFYFSGRACHLHGTNYFIPTDDKPIKSEYDVPDFSINVPHAFELLTERNKSYVTIFIVDGSTPYCLPSRSKLADDDDQCCAAFAPMTDATARANKRSKRPSSIIRRHIAMSISMKSSLVRRRVFVPIINRCL